MTRTALKAVLVLVCTMFGSGVDGDMAGEQPLEITPPSYRKTKNLNSLNMGLRGEHKAPFPTNAWWGNLVLEEGQEVVAPLPYLVRANKKGLIVSYPKESAEKYIVRRSFSNDLQIEGSKGFSERHLLHYDDLTASMQWRSSRENTSMTAYLSRGSPYITLSFDGVPLAIRSGQFIISVSNEQADGTKFQVKLANDQTWLIYTSNPLSLRFKQDEQAIRSNGPFTGVVRIALLLSPEHEQILDEHSDRYAVSGKVDLYYFRDSGYIKFQRETRSMSGLYKGDLLTLALPHHIESKITGTRVLESTYETIKGRMTGILGDTWFCFEDLSTITWSSPRGMDFDKIPAIKKAVSRDQFRMPESSDVYQFAKQLAGLGRVALIADEIGDNETATTIREKMKDQIEPWFKGENVHELLYDTDWGGVVTKKSIENRLDDFGSAMYNDHHFQYGYFTYAAAVIGRTDKAWLKKKSDKVLELVRDYANPNRNDSHFPFARHFDFYMGHSWAGGLWVFDAGKNQESSSEAVNSYYAIHLLGVAMGNKELSNWGRMLMAMEIRSTKLYWHITSKSQIYPKNFAKNKIVGIMWSNKVDYSTWFGRNAEFIHCIQYLPFTPITEVLLGADYVEEAYPVLGTALTRSEPVLSEWWRGYIIMAQAMFAKDAAWTAAKKLKEFDLGNSQANTLYWIATRPAASATIKIEGVSQLVDERDQISA